MYTKYVRMYIFLKLIMDMLPSYKIFRYELINNL